MLHKLRLPALKQWQKHAARSDQMEVAKTVKAGKRKRHVFGDTRDCKSDANK
jgi:hypothetical protein